MSWTKSGLKMYGTVSISLLINRDYLVIIINLYIDGPETQITAGRCTVFVPYINAENCQENYA